MAEERAQRRLAAILAADVVGYSRLMEQDEAGTLAALADRRKAIFEPLLANVPCSHVGTAISHRKLVVRSVCGSRGRSASQPDASVAAETTGRFTGAHG